MQNINVHTFQIFMNFFTSLWCIFVDTPFLVHGDTVLNVCYWHDSVTADKSHLTACSVLFSDIAVCNCTLFGYPVFQPVVKALFDIISDFLKIQINVCCYAIVIMNTYQIGVIHLNQLVLHSCVIGLSYFTDYLFRISLDFRKFLFLDVRLHNIFRLSLFGFALFPYFQLKAEKFGIVAFQVNYL